MNARTKQITEAVARVIHSLNQAKKLLTEGADTDEYLYQNIKLRSVARPRAAQLQLEYEELSGQQPSKQEDTTDKATDESKRGQSSPKSEPCHSNFSTRHQSMPRLSSQLSNPFLYNPRAVNGILLMPSGHGKTEFCNGPSGFGGRAAHGPHKVVDADELVSGLWGRNPAGMSIQRWRQKIVAIRNKRASRAARQALVLVNAESEQVVQEWIQQVPVVAVSVAAFTRRSGHAARVKEAYARCLHGKGRKHNEFQLRARKRIDNVNAMYVRTLGRVRLRS